MRCSHFAILFLLVMQAAVRAQDSAPAAVIVDNRQLWMVKVSRPGFGTAERAEDIRSNIVHVAEDGRRNIADVREVNLESESILLVSRAYIFGVTDEDALVEGRPRKELFAERKRLVLEALARYRNDRFAGTLLRSAALAAGALILAVAAMFLLFLTHKRISPAVERLLAVRTRASRLANLYRIFEKPLILLVRLSLRAGFFLIGFAVVFSLISYALGLFPATMGLSGAAVERAWQVLGTLGGNIVSYLPNLLVLVLVAATAYAAIRTARALANAIESGALHISGFYREWASPTYDLVRILLILFALVVAFPYLPGGESQVLKGASIFIGVLVSLGSGSAMANVVAGVILTYMRPFRVGDRVQIADTTGDVMERSLLVTRIRTIKNVEVILPNSRVLGAHILNYSAHAGDRGLILHTTVTLGYDTPWRQAQELLIAAARRTAGILQDPSPFVLQTSLNDSHISYELNVYTKEANRMAELYSELHKNIQEEFNQAGAEIMSPMYLSIRDGNTVTTPQEHRPSGYVAPAFRVHSEGVAEPPVR